MFGIIYYFLTFQSLKSQLREESDCDIEHVQVQNVHSTFDISLVNSALIDSIAIEQA